jgi:hypothetical protein
MRLAAAILAAALALVALGCGGDDATTATEATETRSPRPAASPERKPRAFPVISDRDDPRFATVAIGDPRKALPRIEPPDRPAPRKFLVRDLEVGSGPAAQGGDEVAIWYYAVDYADGKRHFEGWPPPPDPFEVQLGSYREADIWEKAITGMRPGGRREAIVPSRLAFGDGALDYVFVMARVEPASETEPPGG